MTKYKSDYNPIKDYWIAIENGEVVSAKVKKVYAKLVKDLPSVS